jgi:hypothetical protein
MQEEQGMSGRSPEHRRPLLARCAAQSDAYSHRSATSGRRNRHTRHVEFLGHHQNQDLHTEFAK